jgi:GTP-binding protein
MSSVPVVAVVGRPNVGKSTLVNRIIGSRSAVVEELPGVTRDRREFSADWAGHGFLLVDTGGWEVDPSEDLVVAIREQAEAAVRAADAILFVVDATTGISPDDAGVARLLHDSGTPILLVANKVDDAAREADVHHLWSLGVGQPYPVSALHGRGAGELLDALVATLPDGPGTVELDGTPSLAIVGRPNVGKSTLLNRLSGTQRVLVSPTPGTTRDPIDAIVELDGISYRVVDTAGIRRQARIAEDADHYAVLRARKALADSDVAVLLVDAAEGVTSQDQRVAEEVVEAGAGLVVLLNKWDAADTEQRELTERGVGQRLGFVSWAPLLRGSARTGARLRRLPAAVETARTNRETRVPTGPLNRMVRSWQEEHPPPMRRGRRAKILYATQAGVRPPTVLLFVSGGELPTDYLRFLENRLRREIDLTGTPVRVVGRRRVGSARREDGRYGA